MKYKIIVLALIPLLFMGCNDLFDKGDVEKSYEGPAVVAFKPLNLEASLASGSVSVEVQLIASEARSADLPISFSVSSEVEETTAVAGVHYTIATSSPVTLSSGSWTTNVTLNLIEGSLEEGETVDIRLILEGGPDVPAEETLNTSDIRISG